MDTSKKLRIHQLLSILVITFGLLMLIYMTVIEDEPGDVPLLMIVLGSAWYYIARKRGSSHNQ